MQSQEDIYNKTTSDKIQGLINPPCTKTLKLPIHSYGPFCMRILKEFMEFHNIPKDIDLPESHSSMVTVLSCIFDIMLHSMGDDKRNEVLKDLEDYKANL